MAVASKYRSQRNVTTPETVVGEALKASIVEVAVEKPSKEAVSIGKGS